MVVGLTWWRRLGRLGGKWVLPGGESVVGAWVVRGWGVCPHIGLVIWFVWVRDFPQYLRMPLVVAVGACMTAVVCRTMGGGLVDDRCVVLVELAVSMCPSMCRRGWS